MPRQPPGVPSQRRTGSGDRSGSIISRCRQGLEYGMYLEVLRDLADEALEGQLADEELRRLLVATDLPERDSARAETMRLLHAASRGLKGM
jgi:hypothetical protein